MAAAAARALATAASASMSSSPSSVCQPSLLPSPSLLSSASLSLCDGGWGTTTPGSAQEQYTTKAPAAAAAVPVSGAAAAHPHLQHASSHVGGLFPHRGQLLLRHRGWQRHSCCCALWQPTDGGNHVVCCVPGPGCVLRDLLELSSGPFFALDWFAGQPAKPQRGSIEGGTKPQRCPTSSSKPRSNQHQGSAPCNVRAPRQKKVSSLFLPYVWICAALATGEWILFHRRFSGPLQHRWCALWPLRRQMALGHHRLALSAWRSVRSPHRAHPLLRT